MRMFICATLSFFYKKKPMKLFTFLINKIHGFALRKRGRERGGGGEWREYRDPSSPL